MMGINFFLCIAVGAATIAIALLETVHRRRIQRRTLKDSLNTVQQISDALEELAQLPVEQRGEKRRTISREILLDIEFVVALVFADYDEDPTKDPQVLERTREIMDEIRQLRWELHKALFLFRFRPKLVADCQRLLHAVHRHCLVWVAYARLLQAKYPELYGGIPTDSN